MWHNNLHFRYRVYLMEATSTSKRSQATNYDARRLLIAVAQDCQRQGGRHRLSFEMRIRKGQCTSTRTQSNTASKAARRQKLSTLLSTGIASFRLSGGCSLFEEVEILNRRAKGQVISRIYLQLMIFAKLWRSWFMSSHVVLLSRDIFHTHYTGNTCSENLVDDSIPTAC